MRHEYENARRHAHNTLAEVNRHLDRGNIKNPRHHQMLTDMAEKATRTLNNIDTMEDARPYSDTNIGYSVDARERGRISNNSSDVVRNAMDAIARILPRLSHANDDMDDDTNDNRMYNRRGVPGTGRYRVRRARTRADRFDNRYDDRYDVDDRYDDDDAYDMDDDNDLRVVNMPRWRSARTGRFLPNLYGPSRVRRVRRRADLDDMDNRYNANDRYDIDDRYDDMLDDVRYDDIRRTAHETKRAADDVRRAADEARRTADDARRMADEARRAMDDSRTIYPGTPVMRENRYARYNDARYDSRNDTQDARNDANDYYARNDDTTSDRARRPGPRA